MRFAAIADWDDQKAYPVKFMCEQLGVTTGGYHAWRNRKPSQHQRDDERLAAIIKDVFTRLRGNPGVRRVHAELRVLGERVALKRVHRLMQAAGLQGRHPKAWRKTTVAGAAPVDAPDLIGQAFHADNMNEKWCGDITYIKTWKGWAFLAVVIDLHSRKVVGWAVADHMRTELVIEALSMALTHRKPASGVIYHSDRGCQFTSAEFAKFCKDNGVRRSFGRTGVCYDNAVSESLFATVKKELIHTRPWVDLSTLRKALFSWIEEYYNRQRRHSTLGYLTPHEFESGHRTLEEVAA